MTARPNTEEDWLGFEEELVERFWAIHEMEAYGGPPDFEIPSHKLESQVMLDRFLDDIKDFIGPLPSAEERSL